MWVLSHRGVCDDAVENTLEAFEAAVAQRVDGIETDVRRAKDGALVLLHDRHVGTLRVADHTHAELEAAAGHAIPTVEECLARWPELLWNFELKSQDAAAPLLELLSERDPERVIVSSFLHAAVTRFGHELEASAAVLLAHRPLIGGLPIDIWKRHGIDTVVVACEALDDDLRAALRDADFACWAYGPVDEADHRQCQAWDLTAVITDTPEMLRS